MSHEIERKILNNEKLNSDEANSFLSFVCNRIRYEVGIEDPMDTNYTLCYETSLIFGRLMLFNFGLDVDTINIKKLLQIPLTHFFNIVNLNVDGKNVNYLVDMTFSQFFSDDIRLDDIDGEYGSLVSTDSSFKQIENEDFVKKLRQSGFVELDKIALFKYIGAFLRLCNVKDTDKVLVNIESRLLKK